MNNNLQFRISAALKDIIGRDLITDDFIAVFELVKNAFDAYASRVDIYFEDIYSDGNGTITIIDNGKGMDYDDLVNKWLFVAYSAKKEGTEDIGFDYRDIIHTNRPFAGAKGIGRFSCDRLGKYLELETTKKSKKRRTEILITDWEKFEKDIRDEFIDVSILHATRAESQYGLAHGTSLKIKELRSEWDREKLLKLKDSLAKLINPSRGKGEQGFQIYIHVAEEVDNDEKQVEYYKKVNGEVKNFIFDALGLKTTKIHASISAVDKEGKSYITTELTDGGTLIYEIKEENNFKLLWDVDFSLYYLNKAAKLTFAKRMGLASKRYGHIFLYKNGFRVYPYGEPFEDPLKLDVRKSRRLYNYLGTGELIGQIEIFGNNPEFKETSSRGDGLIKNTTYDELERCFIQILERLETYVIDVQQWGLSIEDKINNPDLSSRLTDLIAQLTKSEGILEFRAPDNLIEILNQSQEGSAEAVVSNLRKIAKETKNDGLMKIAKQAKAKFAMALAAKKQAEEQADIEREKSEQAQRELEGKISENLFLKSVKSQDLDEIISFMHSIGISASTIDNYLSSIYQKMNRGLVIKPEELKNAIEVVSFENRKILSITRFSTKANFKLYAEDVKLDLVSFIKEYAYNILIPLRSEEITISVYDNFKGSFSRTFKPIELSILFDNLLSNSIRAKAKNFDININGKDGKLEIEFIDDGIGIPEENINRIFDFGFTTTSGSGLGLFHISEIVKKIRGNLEVYNKNKKGVKFTLTIK